MKDYRKHQSKISISEIGYGYRSKSILFVHQYDFLAPTNRLYSYPILGVSQRDVKILLKLEV